MPTAEELIHHVQSALANAENHQSKVTQEILNMDGMSGVKTRHFYNNIVNMDDARYLEIGTWKGSTVCSAMYGNKAKVVCIDNWAEFGGPRDEFLTNFNKYKGENDANFIEKNSFEVDVSTLPKFNLYMYDGGHEQEEHYNALTHYYACMDDVFVFIVDDWNWERVRNGTRDAISDLKLKVLFEKEIYTPANCTHDTWWNGIYIAVLQK